MDRTLLSRIILLIAASMICRVMDAQYYFDKLTEENGLSDNRVTCFLKDKTGFLWIGTKNGLNRYDGNLFKVFRPGKVNSISNEVINDIVQDSSGKLWVATMTGLNIYDPNTDHWETIMPAVSGLRNGIPNYLIWDLYIDHFNRIWIVSDVWDLCVMDPVTRKIVYYDWINTWQKLPFGDSISYKSIQRIERKNEQEYWLGTTIGLFSINTETGIFQFHGRGNTGSLVDMKYDPVSGHVFTVDQSGKVFCYDEHANTYRQLHATDQPYPATYWKKRLPQDRSLVMPHPNGILEINTVNLETTLIRNRPALSSTLLPGGSNTVYSDNSGMLWTGTNNGINFLNRHNNTADFIPLSIASDKEATDGMTSAFYDSTEGNYYITSLRTKELFIINESTGIISSIQSIDGKRLSACTNICADISNNIWLLTETNVYRYDRIGKRFSLFQTPNKDQPVIFQDMIEDKQGDLWFASFLDGVYHYKTREKKFYTYGMDEGLYAKSITALKNDPINKSIWLGTFNYGLFRYDPDNGKFINTETVTENLDDAQLNLVRDLEIDSKNRLWVSTYIAGLYFCSDCKIAKKAFNHISVKNGLTESGYYSITSDNQRRLWLLSGKGLSVIDENGNFLYQVRKHPLFSFTNYAPETSYPKRIFYNDRKNELLVPVAGGLMLYYPRENTRASPFTIVLTDITIAGESVIYDSTYRSQTTISIPYRSNSLSFRFAGLNYSDRDLEYEYKLHESDERWIPVGKTALINFPNINSGQYSFLVRAKDSNGNFSTNAAIFDFHVLPPFYRTWWFLLLLFAAVGAIFYAIYKYQLHRKLEVERLRLRISRDLHDDIGSALTSINVLSKVALSKGGEHTELAGYLSRIKESTMATMESMSDIVWAINPKNDKLGSVVSRMKEFAADICEAQGIELFLQLPDQLENLSLDLPQRKSLFLIFKEALNNAVKYSRCTQLHIRFDRLSNRIRMIIKDNGTGFNEETIAPGNGLQNMKERAAECGGSLQINSVADIGTTIVLEIPFTRFGVSSEG